MLLPSAKTTKIKEQIIDDKVTDLMLVFRVTPSGESRLHLIGSILPFGNRDFQFNNEGELVGTGTGLCSCKINVD